MAVHVASTGVLLSLLSDFKKMLLMTDRLPGDFHVRAILPLIAGNFVSTSLMLAYPYANFSAAFDWFHMPRFFVINLMVAIYTTVWDETLIQEKIKISALQELCLM